MAFDLTHARHNPMHCLAPGLFRSLKRGERKKLKLDLTYRYGQGEQVRFVGFEPLAADDLRLLQGLVALAGPKGILLKPQPNSDVGKQLRLLLDSKSTAIEQDALYMEESLPKLLAEIGLTDGGDNIKAARASLLRMSNVTVIVETAELEGSCHLLAYVLNKVDGRLWVALNPHITEAILGRRSYTHIDMVEVRKLESDPARLIHQRLCGWIDPGKSSRVELDTLCSYAWPDDAASDTMRKRRERVRKALSELIALGWSLNEYAKNKWEIRRPKLARNLSPSRL